MAGILHIALRVGNLDVSLAGVAAGVAAGFANLDVACAARHVYGLGHVGDGNVAFFAADGYRGFFRNRYVKVHADARIPRIPGGWTNFVAVAILHDFDAGAIRYLLRVVPVPRPGILLARNSYLSFI